MDEKNYNENSRNLEIILNEKNNNVRIGDQAPLFNANSTFGNIKLSDYRGKWLILFSHPGDFTPVCTTEFIAFSKMYPEFERRNCSLLGLSIDSNPSHLAWVNNIYKNTGIKVPFPIISDLNMKIATMYGMIAPNISDTQTVRNVYYIDPEQKIRAILQYPKTNGRNIGEILRLLDSMQLTDKDNTMTPANWIIGEPTIFPSPTTVQDIFNEKSPNCIDWYLCFKNQTPMENVQRFL